MNTVDQPKHVRGYAENVIGNTAVPQFLFDGCDNFRRRIN